MAKQKVRTRTDQRSFTLVYNDFLESNVLDYYEKLVFIAIKRFADNDTLKAFPSLNRLHNITGISKSKIQEIIVELQNKGVLRVDHRATKEKGNVSNIYTLYDFAELWKSEDAGDMPAVAERYKEDQMIQELTDKGYVVTKAKELDPAPTKVTEPSPTQLKQFDIVNNNQNLKISQEQEQYSIEQIKNYFDYDAMVLDHAVYQDDIDTVINILYDLLNTKKKSIRVGGEDKPTMVVVGRLWKLDKETIIYAIRKYNEQTDRIQNPIAYMTTILYKASEQHKLDLNNQVQYNEARSKKGTE